MARARTWSGTVTNWDTPVWRPLRELVGEEVVGDFMWMHEVELSNHTRVQAYKNIDTRRYIHLNSDLSAFAYQPSGRYLPVDAVRVLVEVFSHLPGLAGVTAGQIEASSRAVARVRRQQAV